MRILVKRRTRSRGTESAFQRKRREAPPVRSERPADATPHKVGAVGIPAQLGTVPSNKYGGITK